MLALTLPLFVGGAVAGGATASTGGPVIVMRVPDQATPYPAAQIHGRLTLRKGCLMIGEAVVFWPAGTRWDTDRKVVTFGGDFEGAPPAPMNTMFVGGGGVYEAGDLGGGPLSKDSLAAIYDCLEKVDSDLLVLAYPGFPQQPLD